MAAVGLSSGSGAGSALELVSRGRERVMALPAKKRGVLIASTAAVLALGAAGWWWAGRTEWRPLFNGLEARDAQQVEQELAAASIPYQTAADGVGVEVPAEQLDKARMEVASKGMPQSGRMGFELFDKPNWVGSEFDEKVNYQRALEGELEHTIATIAAVRSARVHLVLPKDSLFAGEREPAKASVVLKLKRASLPAEQVDSIRNLLSGAVENLSPDAVTLVDADGRADLNPPGRSAAAGSEEAAMEQKLVAMLEPLAGQNNVRAQVSLAYDESSEERTDEMVDPAQVVPLSVEKREEASGSTVARASGIPGTVSNTPAASAQGSAQATTQATQAKPALLKDPLPVYPGAGASPGQSTMEESSTYAVTRHTVHTEDGPGRIRRVSAAVVVNDRASQVGSGKDAHTVWKSRTPDEMKRLNELAQAAIGFDAKRGDTVALENIAFTANEPDATAPAGMTKSLEETENFLRTQPSLLRLAGGVALALLLVFAVVRPAGRQVAAILKEPLALPSPASERTMSLGDVTDAAGALAAGGFADSSANTLSSNASSSVEARTSRQTSGQEFGARMRQRNAAAIDDEGVLEYVSEHIRREPKQSTRLLEAWIGDKGNGGSAGNREVGA